MAANRKLTTIFCADVHGFSRLMGEDEEGTFADLKRFRDAMAGLIAGHDGRVVNTWGDGVIAEFASVVHAVRAAIDVQTELGQRNSAKPERARMLFRIGINLGDVIVDGDDIYGDGVNIAARLQSEAEPGGILISNTVYDQVRNKLTVGFEFLGNLAVKNIDDAVPSYAIRLGEAPSAVRKGPAPVRTPRPVPAAALPAAEKALRLGRLTLPRSSGYLAVAAVAVVAVNLLASPQVFWARWPLLAFAVLGALAWLRRSTHVDRTLGLLILAAATSVLANLFAWDDTFWARWPLLALLLLAALRWLKMRRGR